MELDDNRVLVAGYAVVDVIPCVWCFESHHTFPALVKLRVMLILLCHKYGSLKTIPKPVVFLIIKLYAETCDLLYEYEK